MFFFLKKQNNLEIRGVNFFLRKTIPCIDKFEHKGDVFLKFYIDRIEPFLSTHFILQPCDHCQDHLYIFTLSHLQVMKFVADADECVNGKTLSC